MSGNSLWSWVLALNLMLCLLSLVHTQQCHHRPAQISPTNRVHVDRPQTQPRILSPDRRMKFHVEYHSSVLESNRSKEIQSVVAEVVDRVSRTLSVKQEPGNFLFGTNCEKPRQTVILNGQEYCTVRGCYYAYCGEIMAPEGLSEPCFDCNDDGENCTKSGGPSADREPVHYTLFVASLTASCQEDFIAYSYACRIDDRTDRPVAGVINICPIGLELSRERLLDTLQHEMFHALGFSSSMYGLYRDANGRPLTPREANGLPAYNQKTFEFVWSDRVIQNFTLDWDYINGTTKRSIQALVTPNVLREARAHFGCPSLMGVELEDGGGYGTAMSHFEKRILATESMNGFLTPVRVFSRISLALMEDTGWYIPDYDMADNLNWGKGLGCDFVQKSCKNWIDTRIASGMSPAPWCTKRFETGCHAEGIDVAFCNLNKYDSPISEIFQVFTEINGVDSTELSRIGGNRLADFCPFFEADYRLTWNQSASDLYCTNLEIIDDCRNNECMNGGVCRDVINGYYCDCPVGYAGGFCEHVNVECRVNSECQVNEVCTANQCVCQRDRTRDENYACLGVTDVKEYSMTLTIMEVNGLPAVYHPSLMGHAGEGFRHGIEYEVRQILWNNPTLRGDLLDVVTRDISSGSIIVDLALMFRQNLSDSSSNITLASVAAAMATMQDNVLQKSGTIFTVAMNATVVKDANECEDSAGNDCSPNAQCTNTEGNYECSCYPGYKDTGRKGVLPGRNCTDINECLTTLAKDCSPHADCLNMNGSYSCICWEGYDDKSLDAGRPGRMCDKHVHGFPVGVTIALSVGLGCMVFLAVVLIFIWCNFTRKKASPPQKGSSETRVPHHLPHYHARDVVKNVKKIDYDVELLYDVDNIRHQRHHPHRERDAPYQHLKRKEPHLFHELNGPRPYHKSEEPRPHHKRAEFHPHHKREEPRLFHDPDGPRPLPGAMMVGNLNRSWYYGEDMSHMDSPFVSAGPAVSTVLSSNRQFYNMNI